jgi:hypothetical protein
MLKALPALSIGYTVPSTDDCTKYDKIGCICIQYLYKVHEKSKYTNIYIYYFGLYLPILSLDKVLTDIGIRKLEAE